MNKAAPGSSRLVYLGVSALIGLLALLIALASVLVERGAERREGALIAALAKATPAVAAKNLDDPDFDRLFTVALKGQTAYGSVVRVASRYDASILAVLLSSEGQILALDFVGSSSPSSPFARDAFLASFLGKGGDAAFPQAKAHSSKPEVVSGSTLDLIEGSAVLGRLSAQVRNFHEVSLARGKSGAGTRK